MANEAMTIQRGPQTITLRYRRDSEGNWLVDIAEQPGAHTYGRSLQQARTRMDEVLKLWAFPDDVEVVEDIQLPHIVQDLIANTRQARAELDRQLERWRRDVERTANRLHREGLSVRDAGELLDLSHQRIQQLRGAPGRITKRPNPAVRKPRPRLRVRTSTPKEF
ncbi:MAG TPA: type II toxin-antitoxin system HicB family antitoxin [Candidatus Dormibacteraeota bacterium]|nr:type II toxin-antitoxin system HicB family antitoxin [Candidatus Dormibacteraeota bacterium]HVD02349.1 type II toxin-antitoxin system HicB family antitoxin [Candidatus Dormibacteraeota bacterium]